MSFARITCQPPVERMQFCRPVTFWRQHLSRDGVQPGVWIDEADEVVWQCHGRDCYIRRNPTMFTWCGYAAVSQSHPYFEQKDDFELRVYGGVTFAGTLDVPTVGLDLWWLGFDCAHFADYTPRMPRAGGTYQECTWVMMETEQLAAQLTQLVLDQHR